MSEELRAMSKLRSCSLSQNDVPEISLLLFTAVIRATLYNVVELNIR